MVKIIMEAKNNFSANFSENLSNSEKQPKNNTQNTETNNEVNNERLVALEKLVSELKEQLVRAFAEIENLKKRHQKDVESVAKFANANILKDLIEPYEQLFMALSIKPSQEILQNQTFASLLNGIEMTKNTFEKAFEKHKLKRLYPKGEKFDHNLHQAISQIPNSNVESGTVLEVVQAGYILEDRVIKPAMVVVSA